MAAWELWVERHRAENEALRRKAEADALAAFDGEDFETRRYLHVWQKHQALAVKMSRLEQEMTLLKSAMLRLAAEQGVGAVHEAIEQARVNAPIIEEEV